MADIRRRSLGQGQVWWLKSGFGSHGDNPRDPGEVADSLKGRFTFREAAEDVIGLRTPQAGALHALLARKTLDDAEPSTIVMPTGTGKTETMLAAFCAAPGRTVVVVPSDALRVQIATKFATLGVLPDLQMLDDGALTPVVGLLKSRFRSAAEVDELALQCNVLVTTAAALSGADTSALERLIEVSDQLFVDEAHHVPARTWTRIAEAFTPKLVVQFTATPFREDGQYMPGRVIYAYPLRLAQKEGYFAPINYVAITDVVDPDRALATAAIQQLRGDLESGHDHILMARVKTVARSKEIIDLYQELAADLVPIRVDSRMSQRDRTAAHTALANRTSRVVVCVDMLGEGFDLPALKVAAIHEPHRSLAVTLQFIGRFARVGNENAHLGEATAFVPRQIGLMDDRLRELYAEDSDWNVLVRDLTQREVEQEQARSEFDAAFSVVPDEIAQGSLRPKMSTVVYLSGHLRWQPNAIYDLFEEEELVTRQIAINHRDKVLWFVTAERTDVPWGDVRSLAEIVHHFYLVHCDTEAGRLYINSSNNGSMHQDIAEAVGGDDVALFRGDEIYRVLSGVSRRVPTNVGLLDAVNRNRRFTMHVGADVLEGFGPNAAQKSKTNIFAHGFSGGTRVTFGASRKGRVWSHRVALNLLDWIRWARDVGEVVTDDSITVASVMEGFIIPKAATERPALVPLGIEWPYDIVGTLSEGRQIRASDVEVPLIDVSLAITDWTDSGPLKFKVISDHWELAYSVTFGPNGPVYSADGDDAMVVTRAGSTQLSAFMTSFGMTVFFEQEALLSPDGYLIQPNRTRQRFAARDIQVVDWAEVNIRKESQGPGRDPDSVQHRAMAQLLAEEAWDVVVDDDGTGEVADGVFLRRTDRDLYVLLAHCKFSHGDQPGARLADLYEVCGQAAKSFKARSEMPLVLEKLIRRETRRQTNGQPGIIHGSMEDLLSIATESRVLDVHVTVVIAQPGLSAERMSHPQAELLACTQLYLTETYNSSFRVLASS